MDPFPGTYPDGEMTDGMGLLSLEPSWSPRGLVLWGGLRPGGVVTVHLPQEVKPWLGAYTGKAVCMPNAGFLCAWTFAFGYSDWVGAVLCRRCFDTKNLPKRRHMPQGGWWTFRKYPKEETQAIAGAKSREVAVRRILSGPAEGYKEEETSHAHSRRIVEV